MSKTIVAAAFALSLAALALPGVAQAQNIMKECGVEYQAAKAGNTLGGKAWKEFLADCRTRHAASATPAAAPAPAPAAAAPAAPPPPVAMAPKPMAPAAAAPAPMPAPTAAAKPVSGGRQAMLTRERACGAEWKANKVELRKANPAIKWPQYWSECNTRMKAAGQ